MLGDKLKELRNAKKITQEELAKILEVSTSMVGMYETGARRPSYEVLIKIAKYFGVTTDYLLSAEEKLNIAMNTLTEINRIAKEGLESNKRKNHNNVDVSSIRPLQEVRMIPKVGRIAAGVPILAEENIEGYMPIDTFFLDQNKQYYLLQVKGDSMNVEFQDGTWVLVERTSCLENGQLGVVLINGGEATVKKVVLNNNMITLIPMSTNPVHRPVMYNIEKDDVRIQGRVIMALKTY